MKTCITVKTLEMNKPPGVSTPKSGLEVRRSKFPSPTLNRYFYATVGSDWMWYSKLKWSYADWNEIVRQPTYQTWVGYHQDTPAGYFELDHRVRGSVEVVNFGLLPEFCGLGLGRAMVKACVRSAWEIPDTNRVWLTTCSLDHPAALHNYMSAGFNVVKTENRDEDVPEDTTPPWPTYGTRP